MGGSCWSPRSNLSQQSPGLLTMKMAVVNNQAAIYYESGQLEAGAGAMRNLSETLASIPRSFLCGRWGTFRLNVMVVDALSQPRHDVCKRSERSIVGNTKARDKNPSHSGGDDHSTSKSIFLFQRNSQEGPTMRRKCLIS